MSAPFASQARKFGELLGQYSKPLVVPEFQRGYSWEKAQVATFWDDLHAFHEGRQAGVGPATYFLGPIVLLEEKSRIVVLDGQQRLATATILLSVLRDAARDLDTQEGPDFARDTQRDLIEREQQEYSLTLGDVDATYFCKTVQHDPPSISDPALRSHQLISSALKELRSSVGAQLKGRRPKDAVQMLRSFRDLVAKHVVMVAISVESEEDAFLIFETLNDRGLRLSVPDLLLNYLMRTSRNPREKQAVRRHWISVLENMGRRDTGKFLRQMWLSKYGDVKARGLFREIKQTIEAKRVSRVTFAETCADECESYTAILDVNDRVLGKAACAHVTALVRLLGAHVTLPLLLSGLRCLSKNDFEKLARMTVGIVVRHSIIANLNPYDLEAAVYESARSVRKTHGKTKRSAECLRSARTIMTRINPTNSVVISGVQDLSLNRNQARYILTCLANHIQSRTKELAVNDVSIEHIFPLNPNDEWRNRDELALFKWHIGNLTVLGTKLNSKAANSGFGIKRRTYYARSEIKMTRQIAEKYKQWTPDDVVRRADQLSQLVVSTWTGR